jgi:serralysin
LKVSGADQYAIWSTDSSGNYISNIGPVSGTSLALESAETSFYQDLNGDGVIGVPSTNHAGIAAADADITAPAFTGSTLTLDASSPFSGQIIGFAGNGSLQGSDQIDLRGMHYDSIHSTYDGSTGILAVDDGSNTTDIHFLVNYSQDSFKFTSDGGGGTIVDAQSGSNQPSISGGGASPMQAIGSHVSNPGQESFVFASNFGQVTIPNFSVSTDIIQVGETVFASVGALLTATRDDSDGSAVITDAAHDAITIQNVTTAQLPAHQGDFQLV